MRRLSNGSNYLGAFVDEEDPELDTLSEAPLSRRTSTNSRRSSINSFRGGYNDNRSGHQSSVEQKRIAEMYKMVIKLSAENKINMKNSWSFDLIDHMGKLIREDGRSVNFQKASCTLDASVKIYSHRVDDTHASSHRILESLSRNDGSPADSNDDTDSLDPENPTKRTVKVGSKANSTRLNIESAIEKNVNVINQQIIEKSQCMDPLFHRMSKAFDEGGVKGMLLNNMRMQANSSTLVFSSDMIQSNNNNNTSTVNEIDTTSTTNTNITPLPSFQVCDLLRQIGNIDTILQEFHEMKSICPALNDYRQEFDCMSYIENDPLIRSYLEFIPPILPTTTITTTTAITTSAQKSIPSTYDTRNSIVNNDMTYPESIDDYTYGDVDMNTKSMNDGHYMHIPPETTTSTTTTSTAMANTASMDSTLGVNNDNITYTKYWSMNDGHYMHIPPETTTTSTTSTAMANTASIDSTIGVNNDNITYTKYWSMNDGHYMHIPPETTTTSTTMANTASIDSTIGVNNDNITYTKYWSMNDGHYMHIPPETTTSTTMANTASMDSTIGVNNDDITYTKYWSTLDLPTENPITTINTTNTTNTTIANTASMDSTLGVNNDDITYTKYWSTLDLPTENPIITTTNTTNSMDMMMDGMYPSDNMDMDMDMDMDDNDYDDNNDPSVSDMNKINLITSTTDGDHYIMKEANVEGTDKAISRISTHSDATMVTNEYNDTIRGDGRETIVGYQPQQIDIVPISDDYTYFNLHDMMNKQNSWAGAKHWKFGGKLRSAYINSQSNSSTTPSRDDSDPNMTNTMKGDDDDEETVGTKKGRKKSNKSTKKSDFIDFFSELPSQDPFKIPKNTKSNTTLLTPANLAKHKQNEREQLLDLPPDAKLHIKDLCRLFVSPAIIIPPSQYGYGKVLLNQMASEMKPLSCVTERIWGSTPQLVHGKRPRHGPNQIQQQNKGITYNDSTSHTTTTATATSNHVGKMSLSNIHVYEDHNYGGDDVYNNDMYDDDDDNGNVDYRTHSHIIPQVQLQVDEDNMNSITEQVSQLFSQDSQNTQQPLLTSTGLSINNNQLLKATRVVEKVDIGYATTSTKVNVRKLKSDIWSHIDTTRRRSSVNRGSLVTDNDVENRLPNTMNSPLNTRKSTSKTLHYDDDVDITTKTSTNTTTGNTTDCISFKELIQDVGERQEQKHVSLPFYFICLLHLANEKTLEITDTKEMDDLIIKW